MEKISVVIPVYNVEEFLGECLDSILAQTYKNLEIICVNDGSTDKSLDILNEYRQKDDRIIVINKSNEGAATARNLGLKSVSGEFINFFDSDDIMHPQMLEKLYASIVKNQSDFAICKTNNLDMHLNKIVPNEQSVVNKYIENKTVFSPKEYPEYIFQLGVAWPWNKLYRMDFIKKNNLEFQNLRQSNDAYFVLMSYVLANKISVENERLVIHRYHDSSLEATRYKAPKCFYAALKKIYKELKLKKLYKTYQKSFINFCNEFIAWHLYSIEDEKANKIVLQNAKKILKTIKYRSFPQEYFYNEDYYKYICWRIPTLQEIIKQHWDKTKYKIKIVIQKIREKYEYLKKVRFAISCCDWFLTLTNLRDIKIQKCPPKKIPVLKSFVYHLADHCNLCCAGCDHFSPLAKPKLAKIKAFKSDIKRFSEISGKKLCILKLMGGEPLLHPDVINFFKVARKYLPETRIELVTNGILLNLQSAKFWKACNKYSITIVVTKYPLDIDYENAEQTAKKYNVDYEYFGDTGEVLKTSYHIPLDVEGKQNPEENFKNCFHANNCIMMKDGKLYTCTVAPNIEHFNKYFKYNIPLDCCDGINIYQVNSIQEIIDFLSKPIPFCKYCNVKERTYQHPWSVSSRNVSEWT